MRVKLGLLSMGLLCLVVALYLLYIDALLWEANPRTLRIAFEEQLDDRIIADLVSKVKHLKLQLSFGIPIFGLVGLLIVASSFRPGSGSGNE